jgi:hypothetical protein
LALALTNPTGGFDKLETLAFDYRAKMGQKSRATLYVKLAKYKEIDGVFAYSDEAPIEFFVKDVGAYVTEQAGPGTPSVVIT